MSKSIQTKVSASHFTKSNIINIDYNIKPTNQFILIFVIEFSTNESYFVFRVAHRQTQFKEIKQIRAYDPESLYGDIGGYMGLLLGYSILNLPSMIAVCYGFIKNRFSNQKQLRQNRQKAGKIDAWLLSDHLNTMVRTETINIDKTIVENVEKRHEKLTEINTDSDLIIENCIGD